MLIPDSWKFSPGDKVLPLSPPALMGEVFISLSHVNEYIKPDNGDLHHMGENLLCETSLQCMGRWGGQNFCPAKIFSCTVVIRSIDHSNFDTTTNLTVV